MDTNRRIIYNTVILYIKYILTTIISFVTSRLVLDALGASDYGLYNVVGGIVVMLNTLGTGMVATSYRYLAIEIGKGESGDPNRIYNTVLVIHLFLAVFLLFMGETLGVHYVNNYLNVDAAKIPDALFVLRVSLITTALAVITIPTNGLIIAREKFLFTSVVEIVSALFKVGFIVALSYINHDKLRYYALFLGICQLIMPVCYQLYCVKNDREVVKWRFNKNVKDYKEIFFFAWWILLGALACIGRVQGVAVVMNIFFGTVVNAAFGLATQVNSALSQFTATVQQAAAPQIMKSQGGGDQERSISLVYIVARYSVLIMSAIGLPIIFCINSLLFLWLKEPPQYTNIFIVLLTINAIVGNLGSGIDASIQATGKIRVNQIGYAAINLSIIPILFIIYKFNAPVYYNVIIMIVLTLITLAFQLYLMIKLSLFSIRRYFRETLMPSLISVSSSSILIYLLLKVYKPSDVITTVIFCLVSFIITLVCTYFAGLSIVERKYIKCLLTKCR